MLWQRENKPNSYQILCKPSWQTRDKYQKKNWGKRGAGRKRLTIFDQGGRKRGQKPKKQ